MSKETFNGNPAEDPGDYSFDIEALSLDSSTLDSDRSNDLEARLLSSDNFSSSLPSLSFAASATYSRDGFDLVLTLEGESVVVKNYFATPTPPTLTTTDGAVLTPEMVASFLQHGFEQNFYASSLLKNLLGGNKPLDNDAVAVVENLEGDVLAIRKGEAITLQNGDQLFQGDEIATATDSSAGMVFADGTRFKIGGEARISLDQFSFETSTSQGLQVLSILSGAFSYVSGLVAKNDPANVQLRTPIGEIGIRGTKIVGVVDAENAEASITLLEGRILYRTPQGEEHEITQGFETLTIKDGGNKVKETIISAERVARSYDVFEDVGEVSNFLQQQPATLQNQDGAGASTGTDADIALPDIPLSQAQEELKALVVRSVKDSLEGSSSSIDDELIEQVTSIELQRAEVLQETLGKDQTDDESLIANNIGIGGNSNTGKTGTGDNSNTGTTGTGGNSNTGTTGTGSEPPTRGGDDNFHIDLATLDGKIWVDFGTGGGATYDTLNFQLANNIDTLVLTFAKGLYTAGSANTDSTFIFPDTNSNIQELSWGVESQVAGSLSDSPYDAPPANSDDLMITATFDSDGDGNDEVFRIVFDEYFPTNNPLPTYSISINGGTAKDLATYDSDIVALIG